MSMQRREIDLVELWCRERTPENGWKHHPVIPQITGRHIDLIADADGIKTPIARLRYFGSPRGEGSWVLHWRDAEGTFQIYRNLPAADAVSEILDFLASDPDPLFWA